jgi:hypothetical protein
VKRSVTATQQLLASTLEKGTCGRKYEPEQNGASDKGNPPVLEGDRNSKEQETEQPGLLKAVIDLGQRSPLPGVSHYQRKTGFGPGGQSPFEMLDASVEAVVMQSSCHELIHLPTFTDQDEVLLGRLPTEEQGAGNV